MVVVIVVVIVVLVVLVPVLVTVLVDLPGIVVELAVVLLRVVAAV